MKKILFVVFLLFLAKSVHGSEISVPAKVSQGRAFLVSVCDTTPFHAVIHWRGEPVALRLHIEKNLLVYVLAHLKHLLPAAI